MADFNELRGKIKDTIGTVAGIAQDAASKTADWTRGMARVAKLTMEINSERDVIKKAYQEIGKLYYETHGSEPEGFFSQLCDEISLSVENIAEREAEIAEIRSAIGDEDGVEVEFEEVEFEDAVSEAEEEAECSCGCEEHAKKAEEPECGCGCEEHTKKDED